jgi:polyhydroxyalkanoate synthesis regulator phasin
MALLCCDQENQLACLLLQREELTLQRDRLHEELVLHNRHFSEQQRMLPPMKELISRLSSENSELVGRQACLAAERAELAMTLSKFEAEDGPQRLAHYDRCLELESECDSLRNAAVVLQKEAVEARRVALDMEHEAHLYKGKLERLERGAAQDATAAESVSKKALHDAQAARIAELTKRLAELENMHARAQGLQELQNALGSLQGAQRFITALDGASPPRSSQREPRLLGLDDSLPTEHSALKERLGAEEAKLRWLRQALGGQSPSTDRIGRHLGPSPGDRLVQRRVLQNAQGPPLQTSPSPSQLAEMCFYLGYEGLETPHKTLAATLRPRTYS